MMGRDPPPSSTIALWSTRYLPNHLDQFGPKDVVGAATALGRLKAGISEGQLYDVKM